MAKSNVAIEAITTEPEIINSPSTHEDSTLTKPSVEEKEDGKEEKDDMAESCYESDLDIRINRGNVIHHNRGRIEYSPPPRPRGFATRIHEVPILVDTKSLNKFIKMDDVCVDMASNQMVYIANHPFANADLDKISWIFKLGTVDAWVPKPKIVATANGYHADLLGPEKERRGRRYDNVDCYYEDAYDRMGRPSTTIAKLGNALRVFRSDEKKYETDKVKFVIVVQGKNNAAWVKLMVAHSRQDALVEIFHMILNGHSILFVGAVLLDVVVPLEGPKPKVRFLKVDGIQEAKEVGSGVVGVIC